MNTDFTTYCLAEILRRTDALDFGSFTLTSGKKSPYYIDLRTLPSFPVLFELAADLSRLTVESNNLNPDVICAVPTGGLPLGTLLAHKLNLKLTYVRKKAKEHGEKQQIEGIVEEGETALVVDDLITTGGSVAETVTVLKANNIKVDNALVLLDREESGKENLKTGSDVRLHSLASISEIIEVFKNRSWITTHQSEKVLQYIRR